MTSRACLGLLGLFSLILPGCGGTATVSGKVTFEGKPVVWGSVTLMDEKGQYHQGAIELDGTYKVENVPAGKVNIGVFSSKPPDDAPAAVMAPKPPGGVEDPRAKFKSAQPAVPKPPTGAWFPIPDKFSDPASSGLTGTVTSGRTTLPIDIR